MKIFSIRAFCIILILFFSFENAKSSEPVILKNADSLLGTAEDNLQYRTFIGNVVFEQGDVILFCDTARQYMNINKIELMSNIRIIQNQTTIFANRIDYFGDKKTAISNTKFTIIDKSNKLTASKGEYNTETETGHFYGDVSIENDTIQIFSQELIYNSKTAVSIAYNDVRVFGRQTQYAITSDTLIYHQNDRFLNANGKPIFYYVDTLKKHWDVLANQYFYTFDTLTVSSHHLIGSQSLNSEEYYQFTDSVEINKGNIAARCMEASYFKNQANLELKGAPVVWYDSLQLFADTIIVYFPNNKIEKIQLYHNSLALLKNDTTDQRKIDQISGEYIDIYFENDSLKSLVSKMQANSLYFTKDEQGENGLQSSGADTIHIYMAENTVSDITWKSAAYIEFYPESMFGADLTKYYLPKFRIRFDRPQKKNYPTIPSYYLETAKYQQK